MKNKEEIRDLTDSFHEMQCLNCNLKGKYGDLFYNEDFQKECQRCGSDLISIVKDMNNNLKDKVLGVDFDCTLVQKVISLFLEKMFLMQ